MQGTHANLGLQILAGFIQLNERLWKGLYSLFVTKLGTMNKHKQVVLLISKWKRIAIQLCALVVKV